jgi:alkanesulfonate monooxygenase SsuD/methylene tetrahydromethanopterin reductase-like flavin-dependent oxidoreductase (luciferase family)
MDLPRAALLQHSVPHLAAQVVPEAQTPHRVAAAGVGTGMILAAARLADGWASATNGPAAVQALLPPLPHRRAAGCAGRRGLSEKIFPICAREGAANAISDALTSTAATREGIVRSIVRGYSANRLATSYRLKAAR